MQPIPSLNESLPFKILMVEDNLADIKLMQEAIRITGLKAVAEAEYATHAEEGYALLHRAHLAHWLYDLMIIDLHMPRIDGKEMLASLKDDARYSSIPIFIMSNSDAIRDMSECYNLGADGYIQKPAEFQRLLDFFEAIKYSLIHDGQASADHIDLRYAQLKTMNKR